MAAGFGVHIWEASARALAKLIQHARSVVAASSLWHHSDFLKLWGGQSMSLLGSQVSLLALPLVAVVTLRASAAQMGILRALGVAPFLLFGLLVGVWVDRARRRPVMIISQLGQALLLATIPAAALLGRLGLPQLMLVAFGTGLLRVFFDVAHQSYLPSLVDRDQLLEANSKLQFSTSTAQVAGPGLAGVLIQSVTAPVAVVVDVISFLAAGLSFGLIRSAEPAPASGAQPAGVWAEIKEGLAALFGSRLLRPIALTTALANPFLAAQLTLYVLFAVTELHLTAPELGLVLSASAPGAVLASWSGRRLAGRVGLGHTLIGAMVLGNAMLGVPALAPSQLLLAIPILAAAGFVLSFCMVAYNVNQISLRQAITPDRLLGRVNASLRFVTWGTLPLGALLGGFLGERLGLRTTLALIGAGALLAGLVLLPIRGLREIPTDRELMEDRPPATPRA